MYPKVKRLVDEKLLSVIRTNPCLFCGKSAPSEVHHLKSVKSGGPDEEWNCIPVDRICHIEVHKRGLIFMMNKYLHAGVILGKMGWGVDPYGRMRNFKKEK